MINQLYKFKSKLREVREVSRDMKEEIWENMISLNPPDREFKIFGPAKDHRESNSHSPNWKAENLPFAEALARDTYPLPATEDRENYYGPHHFSYWASGLRDMRNLLQCAGHYNLEVNTYLDIGCSSGRVIRHFAINSDVERVIGCDINRKCIEWILAYLPQQIEVFQNNSIPNLQLEDSSIDLISALSVFTHIENFDLAWMMEIKRILRPGGIAWITFHSEQLWTNMKESSAMYRNWCAHPEFTAQRRQMHKKFDRLVFRRRNNRSYSSNVFYNTDFLCNRWGRILDVLEVRRRVPAYQDVIILRKSS